MLLHGFEDYFYIDSEGEPYSTGTEELRDGLAFVEMVLEAYATAVIRRQREAGLPLSSSIGVMDEAGVAGYFADMPEGRFSVKACKDDHGEIDRALAYIRKRERASARHPQMVARLKEALGLDEAEVFAMLLAASVQIDVKFANICRALSVMEKESFPTVALCQRLLDFIEMKEPEGGGLFASDGRLFTWLLVRRVDGGRVLRPRGTEPLVILPYVLRLLTGDGGLPRGLCREEAPEGTDFFENEANAVAMDVRQAREMGASSATARVRVIKALDVEDVRYVLARAAQMAGCPLYVVKAGALPETASGMQAYLLGLRLFPGMLLVYRDNADKGAGDVPEGRFKSFIRTIVRQFPDIFVYIYGEGVWMADEPDMEPGIIRLLIPDVRERIRMWEHFLCKEALIPDKDVDIFDIADLHENTFGQIRRVARGARETLLARGAKAVPAYDEAEKAGAPQDAAKAVPAGGETEKAGASQDGAKAVPAYDEAEKAGAPQSGVTPEKPPLLLGRKLLQELLFSLSTTNFDNLATEIHAHYTWDDIFLEEAAKTRLKAACDRFRLRNRIGAEWGINRKNAYGNAVIVLMYGAPGTGKTMAAQAIANEVMTPLYRVDVSQIFSKYIGETQKNLSKIFDEAAKRSVVLFFDEADALFTRRTEIRDSHDKYANSDTSFLLQKVEEYNGISILATNNYQSFDPAFMRRLTYVVRFERPDEETRRKMWETMLPEEVPMGPDVDYAFLAEHFTELSGSNIKSILLTAAYMAAAKKGVVGMREIVTAIVYEHEKLGRLVDSGDFGSYAMYLKVFE